MPESKVEYSACEREAWRPLTNMLGNTSVYAGDGTCMCEDIQQKAHMFENRPARGSVPATILCGATTVCRPCASTPGRLEGGLAQRLSTQTPKSNLSLFITAGMVVERKPCVRGEKE